ncbi:MAG: nickel pincer cofactor biosynthesis protein LarC [Bryobacterales bacterium]|nr:nickel pincer cofactor biosynthesis protein LarC [Bryobacterales bacterium]
MRICYLDAFSGISGDMLVGALADAGADPAAIIAALSSLGTGAEFRFEKTMRRAIGATKFHVTGGDAKKHRHLSHILQMIGQAELPDRVKRDASAVFTRLGEAEAGVHQVPVERVHFHEVGAADSIADIVGACLGFHLLGVEEIHCSAINTGSGTVSTEHGVMPVPAPATAALLRGKPVYARGPQMELTTPTGAALAVTLAASFGPLPAMTIQAVGYGAGAKDFQENANVLRVIAGAGSGATEATVVSVIEANLDDLSPQILAYTMERLISRGALDVSFSPVFMKKNRPGTLLRIIARPETQEEMAQILLSETSTLGVRIYAAERRCQGRRIVEVATPYGTVRVKVGENGAYAPEYEDCRKLALESGAPLKQVLAEANLAYWNSRK